MGTEPPPGPPSGDQVRVPVHAERGLPRLLCPRDHSVLGVALDAAKAATQDGSCTRGMVPACFKTQPGAKASASGGATCIQATWAGGVVAVHPKAARSPNNRRRRAAVTAVGAVAAADGAATAAGPAIGAAAVAAGAAAVTAKAA